MGHNFTKVIISRRLPISYVKFLVVRDVSQGDFKFSLILFSFFIFKINFVVSDYGYPPDKTSAFIPICVYPYLRLGAFICGYKKTKKHGRDLSPTSLTNTNK
ncbi:MAG: hypothetical protein RLZZ338_3485 [Cyanobacteriota bacterium]|jgi:hypothetical protein